MRHGSQAVKSMPQVRTHLETLIDRLNNVRDNIDRLQTSLDEVMQQFLYTLVV